MIGCFFSEDAFLASDSHSPKKASSGSCGMIPCLTDSFCTLFLAHVLFSVLLQKLGRIVGCSRSSIGSSFMKSLAILSSTSNSLSGDLKAKRVGFRGVCMGIKSLRLDIQDLRSSESGFPIAETNDLFRVACPPKYSNY